MILEIRHLRVVQAIVREGSVTKAAESLYLTQPAVSHTLKDMESRLGVRATEGHLLVYLGAYGPCPVGELVRVFGWKKSTLTSVLDRLEERGVLERSLNPRDRRSFLVELSPAGHDLARRVYEPVDELERLISEQIGEADLAGFRNVMAAIDAVTSFEVRPEKATAEKEIA